MKQPKTIDLDQIMQLRTYHAQQVQRCDDVLALARDVGKLAKKAHLTMGKVRARVGVRGGTSESAKYRHAKANGTRPSDRLRAIFLAANKPLTREQLLDESGFVGTVSGGPPNMHKEGQARRMLGLALSQMKQRREIRETKDGFVALKLQPIPSANGAHP